MPMDRSAVVISRFPFYYTHDVLTPVNPKFECLEEESRSSLLSEALFSIKTFYCDPSTFSDQIAVPVNSMLALFQAAQKWILF